MQRISFCFFFLACVFVAEPLCPAQAPAIAPAGAREQANASAAFLRARAAGPLQLRTFLAAMPKGADLHMHLSGAVYAETFLRDATGPDDLLCVDPAKLAFTKNIGTTAGTPVGPVCPEHTVPASQAFRDQHLYDALVDAFSMRSFVPSSGISGHDQFFATFDRFGGLNKNHGGEWLDEVATRAAAQNEQYLEVMLTPGFSNAAQLGLRLGWPAAQQAGANGDSSELPQPDGTSRAELASLRDKLLAGGLREEIASARAQLDRDVAERARLEHCGTPAAAPACAVEVRILYQVLRAFSPERVFAQTLLGFELASVDPRFVGINFVQPEDAYLSMSEYHRQMEMLDYLHAVYPKVHISLHAGEVAEGLVPPAGLRFHIREAVELGHAERIGHGVDVMYEKDSDALLKEMHDRHVMVEINLTSNDVILGVKAPNHPLPNYLAAGVPVALSTDDEGVSRIDLSHEYTRAVLEYNLGYFDLKTMARTSLEHTFLPGASLWQSADVFTTPVSPCSSQAIGADHPSEACSAFLNGSSHAAQQWELERRFRVFEEHLSAEQPHPTPAKHTRRRAK